MYCDFRNRELFREFTSERQLHSDRMFICVYLTQSLSRCIGVYIPQKIRNTNRYLNPRAFTLE